MRAFSTANDESAPLVRVCACSPCGPQLQSLSPRERNKTSLRRSVLMEGKGTEKRPEMFMTYRNLIAATIVVTVCILAGSNAMAQRHGGFSGGGFRGGGSAFGRTGFNSGGFRGGFNGHGFRGDRWTSYPRPMVVSPPAVARFPSSTNLAPRFRWISGNRISKWLNAV